MIIKNVNPSKLQDDLINAGIMPISVINDRKEGQIVAENTWITFTEDTDMDLAQQIIDTHDPMPLPPQPTEIDYLLDLDFRLSMIELGL